MMLRTVTLAVGFAVFASACSVLPQATPIDYYTLQPAPVAQQNRPVKLSNIRVSQPELNDALQLERIVRITDSGSILAYPNAKWSTSISALWQSWLLDALWRDSRFSNISSEQQGLDSDWRLAGRLQSFHIEETSAGPVAIVRYDAQLIATKQRKVVKSMSFSAQTQLSGNETSDAVTALSSASAEVGQELLEWLAASPK